MVFSAITADKISGFALTHGLASGAVENPEVTDVGDENKEPDGSSEMSDG